MTDDQETADETKEEAIAPFEIPPQAGNLVPLLLEAGEVDPAVSRFIRTDLPDQIAKHFEEDWESRSAWMKKAKDRIKLYTGNVDPPRAPFTEVASMHQPVLLEQILRLAFRILGEFFKDREPIARAIPSSSLGKNEAEIITLVDDWQFKREITDFQAQVMRATIMYLRDGDCIIDSYFDDETGVNRHEALTPQEFVFPYTWHTTAIDMSDVPRKTKILRKYKRDLEALEASGIWHQTDRIHRKDDGTFDDQIDNPIRDLMDSYEGKDRTEVQSDAPYTFLEYRGWCKFPGHKGELPIRATMHYQTKTIVSLLLRQHDDPIDRTRFDKESAEFQAYSQELDAFLHVQEKEQQVLDVMQQPGVDPVESIEVSKAIERQSPPPPIAPTWMQFDEAGAPIPPAPCKQIPIEMTSHATCIENPDGSLGLGIGTLLMPFQEAVNILLNQYVQAAVLANGQSGILHESVKLEPGVKDIAPNEILRAGGSLEAFQKGWIAMKPHPANSQLLEAVKMQLNAAEGVGNAPDVLSGGKEGPETYRGQATRLEQAVQQVSVIASNLVRLISQVYRNNARLNYFHMPQEKLMAVIDPATQEMREVTVSRDLYRDRYEVQFTADMRFASRASKMAEADDALGMATKGIPGPLLQIIAKPQFIAALVRNCLKARGLYDLLRYIKSDEEIEQDIQRQAMMAQQQAMMGAPPGAPRPGGPPGQPSGPKPPAQSPAAPTGMPNRTPGANPPIQLPRSSPVASAVPVR